MVPDSRALRRPGRTRPSPPPPSTGWSSLTRSLPAGLVEFEGSQLLGLGEAEFNRIRASRLAMVFQDPMTSLNPYMRISDQMTEVLILHRGMSRREALAESVRLQRAASFRPHLCVAFAVRPTGVRPWTRARSLWAVRGVCFDLAPGETLGIVGESGSGKSTLARALIGTVPASGGQALRQGEDLLSMRPAQRHRHRCDIQMIFQDPPAALDPRMTAGEIIAEPLAAHEPRLPRDEVRARVAAPIPDPEVERRRRATALTGDLPSPLAPPSGCVFRTRCPVARRSCAEERPAMQDFGNAHFAACPVQHSAPPPYAFRSEESPPRHMP